MSKCVNIICNPLSPENGRKDPITEHVVLVSSLLTLGANFIHLDSVFIVDLNKQMLADKIGNVKELFSKSTK